RADDRHEFAPPDLQPDIVERGDLAAFGREPYGQILHRDGGIGAGECVGGCAHIVTCSGHGLLVGVNFDSQYLAGSSALSRSFALLRTSTVARQSASELVPGASPSVSGVASSGTVCCH